MTLHKKILVARKNKGLTQEELADRASVTVRTVQRVEAGQTIPRPFTLKAMAAVLEIPFEELLGANESENPVPDMPERDLAAPEFVEADNLIRKRLIVVSCFSFLIVPLLHFLIPYFITRRSVPALQAFGMKIVTGQIIWLVVLNLSFLGIFTYNMLDHLYSTHPHPVNYLLPFLVMYLINAVLITKNFLRFRTVETALTAAETAV